MVIVYFEKVRDSFKIIIPMEFITYGGLLLNNKEDEEKEEKKHPS